MQHRRDNQRDEQSDHEEASKRRGGQQTHQSKNSTSSTKSPKYGNQKHLQRNLTTMGNVLLIHERLFEF